MRAKLREPLAKRALSSVQEVVGQYGTWIATIGADDPGPITRYQRLSALADKMEEYVRQGGGMLELDKRESNLLTSCMVFTMTRIVVDIHDKPITESEFQMLCMDLRGLYSVAIEFAGDPVRMIPRLDETQEVPNDVRRIVDAINAKVNTGTVRRMPELTPPEFALPQAPKHEVEQPKPAPLPPPVPESGVPHIQVPGIGGVADVELYTGYGDDEPNTDTPTQQIHVPGIGGVADVEHTIIRDGDTATLESGWQTESAQIIGAGFTPGTDTGMTMPPPGAGSGHEGYERGEGEASDALPLNLACITEPALRRQADADRELLAMALDANEHRVAALMLCSLLEVIILQLGMAQRVDLELRGSPVTWDLGGLLGKFTSAPELAHLRPLLDQTIRGRELLTPAMQIVNPYKPQQEDVRQMLDAVTGFADHVGFLAANAV